MSSLDIDAGSSFEDLHDGFLALHLQDLTTAFGPVGESQLYDFVVGRELA